MPPRLVAAHPYVDAVRGCVALARGPLVYCLEQADLPDGVALEDVRLDPSPPPRGTPPAGAARTAPVDPDRRGRHGRAAGGADAVPRPPGGPHRSRPPVDAHRHPVLPVGQPDPGPMRVWIPVSTDSSVSTEG